MNNPYVDALIFILFIISIGFNGIGVIGLFLFPDIRSRMYTAVRATIIGSGAMVLAVIAYALFVFVSGGGDPYGELVIHALVLMFIVIAANFILYRMVLAKAKTRSDSSHFVQNTDTGNKK